jgi:phospholipid/cholesterol/gamma-HCH transport system substrate-binding protein
MNFLPIGVNPFVGQSARPNEITYTEDWMRPDHVPQPAAATPPDVLPPDTLLPAEAPGAPDVQPHAVPSAGTSSLATDPAAGLAGMMVPGGGS